MSPRSWPRRPTNRTRRAGPFRPWLENLEHRLAPGDLFGSNPFGLSLGEDASNGLVLSAPAEDEPAPLPVPPSPQEGGARVAAAQGNVLVPPWAGASGSGQLIYLDGWFYGLDLVTPSTTDLQMEYLVSSTYALVVRPSGEVSQFYLLGGIVRTPATLMNPQVNDLFVDISTFTEADAGVTLTDTESYSVLTLTGDCGTMTFSIDAATLASDPTLRSGTITALLTLAAVVPPQGSDPAAPVCFEGSNGRLILNFADVLFIPGDDRMPGRADFGPSYGPIVNIGDITPKMGLVTESVVTV